MGEEGEREGGGAEKRRGGEREGRGKGREGRGKRDRVREEGGTGGQVCEV